MHLGAKILDAACKVEPGTKLLNENTGCSSAVAASVTIALPPAAALFKIRLTLVKPSTLIISAPEEKDARDARHPGDTRSLPAIFSNISYAIHRQPASGIE